jgi:uncharacterized repeat protein (TIGR03803 family)
MAAAFLLAPAILAAQAAPSSLFKVLEAFNGTNGNLVEAGPIVDSAGNVYGTTEAGGDLKCKDTLDGANGLGCGIVFEISNLGQLKVLHRFTGPPDGAVSFARLVRDSAGNLYGTTAGGGTGTVCSAGNPPGCGTVFKVDTAGKETVLYNFTGTNGDGSQPFGVLVLDGTGNIYGTTANGGLGFGTFFQVDSTGKETVLYRFKGVTGGDGSFPFLGLVEDQAGNLYGTTTFGGLETPLCPGDGCGVVYKISKTGNETVLYRFTGDGTNGDGAQPTCTLAIDASGNLYGTTQKGGIGAPGLGTIFRISTTGIEKVLHRFNGNDGLDPSGAVQRDATGNLYGTAYGGGSGGAGVVFRLTKAGQETVLHNFTGGKDGANPFGGVVLDSSNNVYGSTQTGGDLNCNALQGSGCGVVFKLTH